MFKFRTRSKSQSNVSSPARQILSADQVEHPPLPPVPTLDPPLDLGQPRPIRQRKLSLAGRVLRRVKSGGLEKSKQDDSREGGDGTRGESTKSRPPLPSLPPLLLAVSTSNGISSASEPSISPSAIGVKTDDSFSTLLGFVHAAGDRISEFQYRPSTPPTPALSHSSSISHPNSSRSALSSPETPQVPEQKHLYSFLSHLPQGYIHSSSDTKTNAPMKSRTTAEDEDALLYGRPEGEIDLSLTFRSESFTPVKTVSLLSSQRQLVELERRTKELGPNGKALLDYTILRLSSSFPKSTPIPQRLTRVLLRPLSMNSSRHLSERGPENNIRATMSRCSIARKFRTGTTRAERIELERGDADAATHETTNLPNVNFDSISLVQALGSNVEDGGPSSTPVDTTPRLQSRSSLPSAEQLMKWAHRPSFAESHEEIVSITGEFQLYRPVISRLTVPSLSISTRIRIIAKLDASEAHLEVAQPASPRRQLRGQYRLPGPIGIQKAQAQQFTASQVQKKKMSRLISAPVIQSKGRKESAHSSDEDDHLPLSILARRSKLMEQLPRSKSSPNLTSSGVKISSQARAAAAVRLSKRPLPSVLTSPISRAALSVPQSPTIPTLKRHTTDLEREKAFLKLNGITNHDTNNKRFSSVPLLKVEPTRASQMMIPLSRSAPTTPDRKSRRVQHNEVCQMQDRSPRRLNTTKSDTTIRQSSRPQLSKQRLDTRISQQGEIKLRPPILPWVPKRDSYHPTTPINASRSMRNQTRSSSYDTFAAEEHERHTKNSSIRYAQSPVVFQHLTPPETDASFSRRRSRSAGASDSGEAVGSSIIVPHPPRSATMNDLNSTRNGHILSYVPQISGGAWMIPPTMMVDARGMPIGIGASNYWAVPNVHHRASMAAQSYH